MIFVSNHILFPVLYFRKFSKLTAGMTKSQELKILRSKSMKGRDSIHQLMHNGVNKWE